MATDTAVVDAIFVHELRIVATPSQLRTLGARFEAARLVYNALLGEDLKRSQLVRESRDYQRALAMTDRKLRRSALRKVDARFGFTRYGLTAGRVGLSQTAGWASSSMLSAFAV